MGRLKNSTFIRKIPSSATPRITSSVTMRSLAATGEKVVVDMQGALGMVRLAHATGRGVRAGSHRGRKSPGRKSSGPEVTGAEVIGTKAGASPPKRKRPAEA